MRGKCVILFTMDTCPVLLRKTTKRNVIPLPHSHRPLPVQSYHWGPTLSPPPLRDGPKSGLLISSTELYCASFEWGLLDSLQIFPVALPDMGCYVCFQPCAYSLPSEMVNLLKGKTPILPRSPGLPRSLQLRLVHRLNEFTGSTWVILNTFKKFFFRE